MAAPSPSPLKLISTLVPSQPVEIELPEGKAQPARVRFPTLGAILTYLESVSGRVDLAILSELLKSTHLTRDDIRSACQFSERSYARNTIARSDAFELLALCWKSGQITPVHDHEGSSCAFKVIHGTGTEIRYTKSDAGVVCPIESIAMPPGYVCAAADADIHQVANLQAGGTDLITLHIYSPPIAQMHTYDIPGSRAGVTAGRACNENVGPFADAI